MKIIICVAAVVVAFFIGWNAAQLRWLNKIGGYPLVFTFTPSVDSAQESMFEPDENGAIGSLRVICSSAGAGVDLGLKCHIQAEVLKKLLSRCQVCAEASLHAYKAGRCADYE